MELAAVLALGCMGAAIGLWSLPRMVLDGAVTALEALLLAIGLLVLIAAAGALTTLAPAASAALAVAFPFALGSLSWIRFQLRDRGLRRLDDAEIERCRRTIAFDARNTGAHVALAQLLQRKGEYAEAIASYEAALALDATSREAKRGIEECLNLSRAGSGQSWICHICHAENEASHVWCPQCRTPRARAEALTDRPVHRYAFWVALGIEAAVLLLVGLGALSSCLAILVGLALGAAVWTVYGHSTDDV